MRRVLQTCYLFKGIKMIGKLSKRKVENQYCEFHGKHKDGKYRVIKDGKRALANAVVSELIPIIDSSSTAKFKRKKIGTSPGYVVGSDDEMSFKAICPETKKIFRIVGTLEFSKKQSATPDLESSINKLNELSQIAKVILSPVTSADKVIDDKFCSEKKPVLTNQALEQSKLNALRIQFNKIAAQRDVGLDPDVTMSFITFYVNESKATLYRKMGKTFPLPIKRGKSSFWPLSQIDAYKAGNYAPICEVN